MKNKWISLLVSFPSFSTIVSAGGYNGGNFVMLDRDNAAEFVEGLKNAIHEVPPSLRPDAVNLLEAAREHFDRRDTSEAWIRIFKNTDDSLNNAFLNSEGVKDYMEILKKIDFRESKLYAWTKEHEDESDETTDEEDNVEALEERLSRAHLSNQKN